MPLASRRCQASLLLVMLGGWVLSATAQSPELELARGIALLSRGDGAGAEEIFRRALEKSPADGRLLGFLGQAQLLAEKYAQAAETLRLALASGQVGGQVRLDLALALIKNGRPDEAERVLLEGEEELRARAAWHYYLGYSRYLQENFSAAVAPLEKALELDQGFSAPAAYYLGLLKAREGRADLARELFSQVAQSALPGGFQELARRNLELLESGPAESRNWSLYAMTGAGYDSNVLLDPRLAGSSSAITALISAGGVYRPVFGAAERLTLSGKIFRSFHTTSRTRGYDLTDAQALAGWEHAFASGQLLRAAYQGQVQFLDGTADLGMDGFGLYKHAHGLNGEIIFREGKKAATRLNYLFQASLFHSGLKGRDNFHHELCVGQRMNLLGGRYLLNFSAGLVWEDARHIFYDLWGPLASLEASWRWSVLELRLQGGWQWEKYLKISRSDQRLLAGASLSVALGKWLNLTGAWEFTDNISNDNDLSYRRQLYYLMLMGRM
jgi:Flp pilus assembly protein TadD